MNALNPQARRPFQPPRSQRTTRILYSDQRPVQVPQAARHSLRSLCQLHSIHLLELAQASGRHPLIIWDMLRYIPVKRIDALPVVHSINTLRQTQYTVKDLEIPLL